MRSIVLAVAVTLAGPSSLAAQEIEAECEIQGLLVQQIVDKRLEGKGRRRAERQIRKDLTEEQARYDSVLAAMVDWVYLQLAEEQLGETVGDSWETQCLQAAEAQASN